MDHQLDYTVSVWGGWNSTTLTSYTVRAVRADEAIQTALARFTRQYGTDHIKSAWIVRAKKVKEDRDLA